MAQQPHRISDSLEAGTQKTETGRNLFTWLLLAPTAAIVVAGYTAIIATLSRGFDWTDESFVYALIASDRHTTGEAWGFQHILHPLFQLLGESVLEFRILRLLGYVALALVLIYIFLAIARALGARLNRQEMALVVLIAQLGTFVAWSYPPRYLGYNELSSWLTQLGAALLVFVVTATIFPDGRSPSRIHYWFLWTSIGAVLIILVLAKVSSAFGFALIGIFALTVRNPKFSFWRRIVATGTGIAGSSLITIALGFPVKSYLVNIFSLSSDAKAQAAFAHPLAAIMDSYVRSLAHSVWILLPTIVLIAITLILLATRLSARNCRLNPTANDALIWISGVLTIASLVVVPNDGTWNNIGFVLLLGGIIATTVPAALATWRVFPLSRHLWSTVVATGILATSGFISGLGTNNPIVGQSIFSATLWAVVAALGLVLLARKLRASNSRAQYFPITLLTTFAVLSGAALAGDMFVHPYRTTPYFQQTTPTTAPELRGILLQSAEAKWADWIHDEAVRLKATDAPTVAIDSPGATFLFSSSGWASPWISSTSPVSFYSLTSTCSSGTPAELFILQPGSANSSWPTTRGVKEALGHCDINFPADFDLVAQRNSNNDSLAMKIWKLHS